MWAQNKWKVEVLSRQALWCRKAHRAASNISAFSSLLFSSSSVVFFPFASLFSLFALFVATVSGDVSFPVSPSHGRCLFSLSPIGHLSLCDLGSWCVGLCGLWAFGVCVLVVVVVVVFVLVLVSA